MTATGPDSPTGAGPGSVSGAFAGDALIYVYGVTRADALTPAAATLIGGLLPGTAVEMASFGGLAAVISRVPCDIFTPRGAETDAAAGLAAERVLAHHRVLNDLATFCTVVPMKFGMTSRNLFAILDTVANSADVFERALARVEGAQEWRVKLHADVEVCRAAVRATLRRPPLPSAPPSGGARAIRVFFRRKACDNLDSEVLRDLAARAESVHRLIATKTKEAASDAACGLCAGWNGYAPALILKSAYLVEKTAEAAFKQAMADLGEALEAEGCTLDVSGPWPPYSFAAADVDGAEPRDG